MSLVKVYDLEGKEHEMEGVDARECVKEMGWSLTNPAETAAAEAAKAEADALAAAEAAKAEADALAAAEAAKAEADAAHKGKK